LRRSTSFAPVAGIKMTLRAPYTLLQSEFNEFLFAPIGEEANDMPLSVVSALTRLEMDPWREASRLSALPRSAAARRLAASIAKLPGGRWAATDAQKIAERLVELLPGKLATVAAAVAPERRRTKRYNARTVLIVVGLAVGAAAVVVALNHAPSSTLDQVFGSTAPPHDR
jgi:hypothetical protein